MITKTLKMTLAAAMLIFTTLSFAAPALSNLHMAKNQLPQKSTAQNNQAKALKNPAAGYYYPTEITVKNNSYDTVFVTIPGSNINHADLWPGEKVFFYSDDYFDFVRIIIYDFYNNKFFDDYVPNYTTVYVDDYFLNAKRSVKARMVH